jgi:hypothetical protein
LGSLDTLGTVISTQNVPNRLLGPAIRKGDHESFMSSGFKREKDFLSYTNPF